MNVKKIGNRGEGIALNALKRIGVRMAEEIGTPFVITNRKKFSGRVWYQGFFKSKVSGDIRGHRGDGCAILAEVKTGEKLLWSTMTKHGEHQSARLDQHADCAISLLVWVRAVDEVYILRWPVPGFGPGKSIDPELAAKLNIVDIDSIF